MKRYTTWRIAEITLDPRASIIDVYCMLFDDVLTLRPRISSAENGLYFSRFMVKSPWKKIVRRESKEILTRNRKHPLHIFLLFISSFFFQDQNQKDWYSIYGTWWDDEPFHSQSFALFEEKNSKVSRRRLALGRAPQNQPIFFKIFMLFLMVATKVPETA